MRVILTILSIFGFIYAQAAQDPTTRHHDCYYNSPLIDHDTIDYVKGMQLQTQFTDSTNIRNEPSLIHTVNISGIVDSVIDTTTIELIMYDGQQSPRLAYFNNVGYMHRVFLRNFKANYTTESPMTRALDSSWIFVPCSLQVKPSDSIFIKGYSTLYKYIWSEYDCNYKWGDYIAGEFFIFPNNTSAIKNSRARKETVIKKRNRDASGKILKNNTARKIIY